MTHGQDFSGYGIFPMRKNFILTFAKIIILLYVKIIVIHKVTIKRSEKMLLIIKFLEIKYRKTENEVEILYFLSDFLLSKSTYSKFRLFS